VIQFRCGGLWHAPFRHETDHLSRYSFIDRMDKATKESIRADLDKLQRKPERR